MVNEEELTGLGIVGWLERIFNAVEEQFTPRRVITMPSDPEYSVPPSTRYVEEETINPDIIERVHIQFFNTDGLVDVKVLYGSERIVPSSDADAEWINKSNVSLEYNIFKNIPKNRSNKPIKVEVRNRDTTYEHRIPVDVVYIPRRWS